MCKDVCPRSVDGVRRHERRLVNHKPLARPSRLLFLLNESELGSHDDARRAVQSLLAEGVLEDAVIIPFPALLLSGRTAAEVNALTLDAARKLDATCILWSHTGDLSVPFDVTSDLRRLPSRPALGHWEGDAYVTWYKPLPKPQWQLLPHCDVIFLPGRLPILGRLRSRGCHDIRYVPSPTDVGRHGAPLVRHAPPEFDVVTIGNRIRSRVPFRTMPGARQRARLVRRFCREFGPRFAVFGEGWSGPSSHGSVPFREQTSVYARGRIVLANAHLHAPYTFSNRLPIAMSSGVPVVHSVIEGSPLLFGTDPPLRFFAGEDEALAAVRDLLARPQEELDALGEAARALALSRFTILAGLRYMVQVLEASRNAALGLHVEPPRNPWLPFEQL